jgi:DNA-binding CsgD family transcriptional regulator
MEISALSPREKEILDLYSRLLGRKAIAQHLKLSENTIATHIRRLLRKIGVSCMAEAVLQFRRTCPHCGELLA